MRLVVGEAVDAAVDRGRDDDGEHDAAGRDDAPRRARAIRSRSSGGRRERERREVDEVPLDDQAREDRREVRALDRGVPAERRRRADALTVTNDAHAGSRPLGARAARAAPAARSRGARPTPIAKAPAAQPPYSRMRPFQNPVAICHSCERWPIRAENASSAPIAEHDRARRRPSASRSRASGARAAMRQATASSATRERHQQRDELRADRRRRARLRQPRARPSRQVGRSTARTIEPERERGGRVGERLLDEDRRVRERGRRDRRDGGEQRPRPRHDACGRSRRPGRSRAPSRAPGRT